MNPKFQFYPSNGSYWGTPTWLYAQFHGEVPNPHRKYHVSADHSSAEIIAKKCLAYLRENDVMHKVVRNRECLERQSNGEHAGKFITIYMPENVEVMNPIITGLAAILSDLEQNHGAKPSPNVPRSRHYSHQFIERPLDLPAMFIYGGHIDTGPEDNSK